jgi:hypothetical protein
MKIHNPDNVRKIETLWAFLSVDGNGMEGIVASGMEGIGMFPLISGEAKNLPILRAAAEKISKMGKKKIVLYKFSQKEMVEEIGWWSPYLVVIDPMERHTLLLRNGLWISIDRITVLEERAYGGEEASLQCG